ncbi:putative Caspase Dronc [Daphnia magna]|uniref:Uncharacterized protein n=2 Tax=Daphnia magna TaxID=35525 RepID=A0ABR0A5F6_9CRUS|nr:hypothetical protein OUZ56_002358 [Daphnia magna]KZS16473.1 putative Caspase Dronc [Daphnia magna]
MSSNLVKDPHASSSRTERNETPATLQEETPQTNAPNETTSAVEGVKEPVYPGSKLFWVNIGSQNTPQYLHLSHDLAKKDKSAQENKRQIFDGFYNCDVPVAILKIETIRSDTTRKELERERRVLTELEVHENFIRYIAHEWDKDFEYIATERCLCSVADLLDQDLMKEVPMKNEILEELGAKEILRQATRGLDYLHQNNFVHRNIKPNNFLIKEINQTGDSSHRFVVKITDFRLTRKRDSSEKLLSGSAASQGWEAPESRNVEKVLSKKLDVFILGCFYHYVLKSKHPFGDNANSRQTNICDPNYSVYKGNLPFVPNKNDNDEVELEKLIKSMLKFEENKRPALEKVLANAYFAPINDYNIYSHDKPGLCVIVNQENFEDSELHCSRYGSSKDRDTLEDIFKKLGFNIEVHKNLSSFDLKSEINSLATRNFKDYGCLVVCLMSHGIENAIVCYDGRFVNTNELKYEFSLNNCPTLYGKPKIFIVQTCQGLLEQSKTGIAPIANPPTIFSRLRSLPRVGYAHMMGRLETPSSVNLAKKDTPNYTEEQIKEMKILDDARRNPQIMDFLTIKATGPGFVSYRESGGSWFIQALCQALSDEYLKSTSQKDLVNLLTSVQENINGFAVGQRVDQTMQWEACLTKYIRFCRANTEGTVIEFTAE